MAISRKDVMDIARLARLEVDDSMAAALERDLSRIVEYVALLGELETSNVPPTTQVDVERAPLRADEVQPSLAHDMALREAPRTTEGGFAVPTFVDE